jgi:hypothetical protein
VRQGCKQPTSCSIHPADIQLYSLSSNFHHMRFQKVLLYFEAEPCESGELPNRSCLIFVACRNIRVLPVTCLFDRIRLSLSLPKFIVRYDIQEQQCASS